MARIGVLGFVPPLSAANHRRAIPMIEKQETEYEKHLMANCNSSWSSKMKLSRESVTRCVRSMCVVGLSVIVMLGTPLAARADESDAKRVLKAMSDYMAAQKALSFEYDATLEVVTGDEQRLALASSGSVTLDRPNKIRVTRSGGFADVEMSFDGKTLTLLGKNLNMYAQIDAPGTVDHLVDELRFKYNRPLPAADLLLSKPYDELMRDVIDVKDLGSGVIGGVECDYLAFRTDEVDWQIWIAHGKRPYPCRYVITSRRISGGPQYIVQLRNWKVGGEVAASDFRFKNRTKADKVELKDLKDANDLPDNFVKGVSE